MSRYSNFEPRVTERCRGTAHPVPSMTTRARVASSLMIREATVVPEQTTAPVTEVHAGGAESFSKESSQVAAGSAALVGVGVEQG